MKNRWDNRNTRKAKMFRFTQRSFQQNRRVTIKRIIDDTLSLDNEEDVYPDIEEVGKLYVERLEKAEVKDTSKQPDILPKYNDSYGRIETNEVKEALKGMKRDTASGPDKCRLKDIKDLSTEEIKQSLINGGVPTYRKRQLNVEPPYFLNRSREESK